MQRQRNLNLNCILFTMILTKNKVLLLFIYKKYFLQN